MTELLLIVGYGVLSCCLGIVNGYWWYKSTHEPMNILTIEDYIKTNYPEPWAAYKKGVHEGYEQGLRDGQVFPDESA